MRILFVAMPDSIHAARWIGQLRDTGWDLHVFPVYESPLHPLFADLTAYALSARRPPGVSSDVRVRGILPTTRIRRLGEAWTKALPRAFHRAGFLGAALRALRPDLVHSLEIQHAGYLTEEARTRAARRFPPWVVSNWGSDVYFFGRQPAHAPRIRRVLEAADYLHVECARDIGLSRQFGFRGELFGVFPGGAGFDLDAMRRLRQPGPTSSRRTIVVSARSGEIGRPLVALEALERCADLLAGYRVVIESADSAVRAAAQRLERSGMRIEAAPPGLPHERILALHGSARVSIRLQLSDAASYFFLEALVLGSFPIQSCTACADEWIADGEGGIIVPPEDADAVAAALRRALTDDDLVDRAAERNAQTASERLDHERIRRQVIERYRAAGERGTT